MKHLNKLYIRIAVLSIICVCICISFYFLMKNGAESLLAIKDHAVNTMLPFIYGLSLAYILNPIMVVTENRLIVPLFERFPKWKDKKSLIRGISVFITIIIFFIIITGLIVLIVPQLIDSIQSMILRTPSYVSRLNKLVSDPLKNNPEFEELFSTYSEQFSRY
ncbi:MAG: AI-2E family transporter, partial [Lachnospiraceae bacterium]|nr:AI-2E family transporter [Lachnospiraceae bacterium]